MKYIKVEYQVSRDYELILGPSVVEVGLTDKNIKETAEFIRDGHMTGELVDIPTHVYSKIMDKAVDAALKELAKAKDGLYDTDDVELQEMLPEDLLKLLPTDIAEELNQYAYDEEEACTSEEASTETDEDVEDEDVDVDVEVGLLYNIENNEYNFVGEEAPTKENTIYLTIKQKYFDDLNSAALLLIFFIRP